VRRQEGQHDEKESLYSMAIDFVAIASQSASDNIHAFHRSRCGQRADPQQDVWAIDGAVLQLNNNLYFVFSSWVGRYQSLFVAPMSNPWTLSGPRVKISEPDLSWEQIGGKTDEGPVALYHEGKTFIIYSASSCVTPDYKLGMLTCAGGDPLSAKAWLKNPEPVFQRSDANGVFGPGHNGFFKSPDGTEDWIVYHANESTSGGCGTSRTTRAQKFTWNADGTPKFGIPVSTREVLAAPSGDRGVDTVPEFGQLEVSRFKSRTYASAYLRHADTAVRVDPATGTRADSQFFVVPGLADSSWIAFESYAQPGSYIGKKFGIMALVKLAEMTTAAAREDATFLEEHETASQR
jgi:hypothetical protein